MNLLSNQLGHCPCPFFGKMCTVGFGAGVHITAAFFAKGFIKLNTPVVQINHRNVFSFAYFLHSGQIFIQRHFYLSILVKIPSFH